MATSWLLRDALLLDPSPRPPSRDDVVSPQPAAILIREGRITAAGSEPQVRRFVRGDEQTLSLAGRCITPGLVDSHCHLDGVGAARLCLDLSRAASKADCLRLVREAATRPRRGWLVGMSLNFNIWSPAERIVTLDELDHAAPGQAVVLHHFDGHSCWANSTALRASGIGPCTEDPPGGRFGRDASGNLTGVLYENAIPRLQPPSLTRAQQREVLQSGMQEYARLGFTAVHAMGADARQSVTGLLSLAEEIRKSGDAALRVRGYPLFVHLSEAVDFRARSTGNWGRVAGIKTFFDGSLNSRTAWMLSPYEGSADDAGMAVMPPEELRQQIGTCNAAGLPLACHAIGDRAVGEALDAFEAAARPGVLNRIEHAQHVAPDDWPRFPRLHVIASMQACHLMPDWAVADRLLGSRASQTYALRSALDAGASIILGTDAPVVSADPRDSLLAAVWRMDREHRPAGGWHAEQRITAAQWLWMHTVSPWQATGESAGFGRLVPGYHADLTIWNASPLDAARTPEAVSNLRADATVVAGHFVHRTF